MPPSPVEIVLVAANDQMPASPQVPARRPCHDAPCACAQSSIRTIPSERQYAAICSTSNAMWPPMWTRKTACGRCSCDLPLEVVERHAQVVAVAVDELDAAAGRLHRERRRHERVRRAEHGAPAHLEVLERRERGAGPARASRPRAGRSTPPQASSKRRGQRARPTTARRRAPRPRARAGARGRGGRSRWRTSRSPWGSRSKAAGRKRPARTNHNNPDGFLNGKRIAASNVAGCIPPSGREMRRKLLYSADHHAVHRGFKVVRSKVLLLAVSAALLAVLAQRGVRPGFARLGQQSDVHGLDGRGPERARHHGDHRLER